MSSSIKCRLPSKVVFCQRSSSIKCLLPSKVVFRQHLLTAMPTLMPIYLFYSWLSCAHCLCCVYTCTVHCLWLYSCLVSESSNYELGRLDNDRCLDQWHHRKSVTGQTDRQTNKQTDSSVYRVAPQLKMMIFHYIVLFENVIIFLIGLVIS